MAFINEEDEEKKPGEGNTQLSSAGGQVITGQSAPAPTSGAPSNSSGRFQNLQNYMNVNKEQAGEFGGQIAGTLSQGVDQAKETINTEVDDFGNKTKEGVTNYDPSLKQKSAQEIMADAALADKYRQGKQGQYQGPQDFTSEKGFTQADQSGERIQNTNSFSGMQSTVKDILTPQAQNYSRGEQTLDSVFLTRPQENRERFTGLRDWASQEIPGAKESAQGRAQDFVKQGVEAAKQAGEQYRGDFDGRTGSINTQVEAERNRVNAERKAAYEAEKARLASEGSGLDEWGNLGYEQSSTPGISVQREAFNPADYLEYGGDVEGANVLTDAQITELRALEQLSNPEYWSNPFAAGRQEAGSAVNFDEAGLNQDRQKHSQVGQQMKEAYNTNVDNTVTTSVQALNQDPTNPQHAQKVYDSAREQPLPPNPQGYRTFGEYLARELGITDGPGMIQHFLKTSAPNMTGVQLTAG